MSVITNLATAQTKTTTTSSESYNYSTTFDMKYKEEILNYLKKEIGENYNTSKQKFVWSKISNLETKNDNIYIKLEDEKIEINYVNKNNLLNSLILKRLKKISDFIESSTK